MLIDTLQRQQAIDPSGSYLVQAPAGSGKTEILTRRYLRLLATVNAPEQIIALTFTRKASSEMRERILLALNQAALKTIASSPHQQETLDLATHALTRSSQLGWDLLKQPTRLQITTIDSLCQRLVQAIPLPEKALCFTKINDKPDKIYLEAARALFDFVHTEKSYQPALKTLLQHLDNRLDQLFSLFSHLLAKRDQWLSWFYHAREREQSYYEEALNLIEQHEIFRLQASLSPEEAAELITLTFTLAQLDLEPSPRYALKSLRNISELNRESAHALASLLLTTQGSLRKSFDHHVGLKRDKVEAQQYDYLKTASKTLLSHLEHNADFLEALVQVKNLPPPAYDLAQWEVLQALFQLLPLLAAQLNMCFSARGEVDFLAISMQALEALGEEDNPTDLALYLDHHIQHLLIDEFQDTSLLQFQLLEKLVSAWQINDGKTLFVVGDPMQSIYRFRAAEVGLFLQAKQRGIGPVALTSLSLSCNFRSTATIVEWVNQQFTGIFPKLDDMESGAISFHPSSHMHAANEHSFIQSYEYKTREEEAAAIVAHIKTELATYPTDKIAILVRSRNALPHLIQHLKMAAIPFQGVEIDALSRLAHLRDVFTLTEALLYPANRLAWLTLLRSPFVGLTIPDVHTIATFSKKMSIFETLSYPTQRAHLSEEGQVRVTFFYEVMKEAIHWRHRERLAVWVHNTLGRLQVKKILNATQQKDLEQYWVLLEQFESNGHIEDIQAFKNELNKLYSKQVTASSVQIMTIHRAKGLEFDCVFLPGLGSRTPPPETPLLRWLHLPSQDHDRLLLISPIKAAHQEEDLLYAYLGRLDSQKSFYEMQRLFYVAATRAKKRLYLFDHHETVSKRTFRSLLPEQLFTPIAATEHAQATITLPKHYRLPREHIPTSSPTPLGVTGKFAFSDSLPRLLGTISHELLEWCCHHHPQHIKEIPWQLASDALALSGLLSQEQAQGLDFIKAQFTRFFEDPIGKWIIHSHEDEHSEHPFIIQTSEGISTKIIDRCFFESEKQWIIDFKTGNDDAVHITKHRQQMQAYAELMARLHTREIHCGLYYLANNRWLTWEYTPVCDMMDISS